MPILWSIFTNLVTLALSIGTVIALILVGWALLFLILHIFSLLCLGEEGEGN